MKALIIHCNHVSSYIYLNLSNFNLINKPCSCWGIVGSDKEYPHLSASLPRKLRKDGTRAAFDVITTTSSAELLWSLKCNLNYLRASGLFRVPTALFVRGNVLCSNPCVLILLVRLKTFRMCFSFIWSYSNQIVISKILFWHFVGAYFNKK